MFVSLGCSGIIPCVHIMIAHGITIALKQASMGWIILMGVLYLTGALLYATRIPERFFPGKCNIVVSFTSNLKNGFSGKYMIIVVYPGEL